MAVAEVKPEEVAALKREAPDVLRELRAKQQAERAKRYPKPTLSDVMNLYTDLKTVWERDRAEMRAYRAVRFQRDTTPEKWGQYLEQERRIHSRLSHNEIMKVAGSITRNMPRVRIPPAGTNKDAVKAAEKETRFWREFWPTMEKKRRGGLRRRFTDSQLADDFGVYEVYLTGAYDDINFERGDDEDERGYLERTESEIIGKGAVAALGVRVLDAMSVYWEEDEEEPERVIIAERKRYRTVYNSVGERFGAKKIEEAKLPRPGDQSWPQDAHAAEGIYTDSGLWTATRGGSDGDVDCFRYYDPVWYVEVIGGLLVECRQHGLPDVPIFIGPCTTTGSSDPAEQMQGIVKGLIDIELTSNDLLTKRYDDVISHKPRTVITQPRADGDVVGGRNKDTGQLNMPIFRWDSPDDVIQLAPGQVPTDLQKDFKPSVSAEDIGLLQQLWQQNGASPVMNGAGLSADTAGYTLNTAMGAALSEYEEPVRNQQRVEAAVIDFCRAIIRDTMEEKIYLQARIADPGKSGTEWLGLGPEDITDVPCELWIDPLNEANRMARAQMLMQGHKAGYVRRRRVQEEGFAVDDPDVEDVSIAEELAYEKNVGVMLQNVYERISPPRPVILGQDGQPLPPSGGGPGGPGGQQVADAGGTPAPPDPPAVGAVAASASRGEGVPGAQGAASQRLGGTNRGYQPPGAGAVRGR